MTINNPHMRQSGWRWAWAGRASLGGRPSSLVIGGCWPMRREVTGRTPSCYLAGRTPRPHRAHSRYLLHRAANSACCQTLTQAQGGQQRMLPDTHRIDCTIALRFVDWAHSQSLWPGALSGHTPGIYASYVTGRIPNPTLLSSSCMPEVVGRTPATRLCNYKPYTEAGHTPRPSVATWALSMTTSQASTRFARLDWPHVYCCYRPSRFNAVCVAKEE